MDQFCTPINIINLPNPPCYTNEKDNFKWTPPPSQDPRLIRFRRTVFIALLFELGSSIMGFTLISIRRSILHTAFNAITFIAVILGFYGTAYIKTWYLFTHWISVFFSCLVAFIGAFVEAFALNSSDDGYIILLLYITFIPDAIVVYFVWRLYYLVRKRMLVAGGEAPDPNDFDQDVPQVQRNGGPVGEIREIETIDEPVATAYDKLCVSCLIREKSTTIYPCGHRELCKECATELMNDERKCPACLSEIRRIG